MTEFVANAVFLRSRAGKEEELAGRLEALGGLGHMAVKFAAAYGCDVTAFTSSDSKFDEAKGFGANHVVSSKDSAAIKKLGSFDLLIGTVNVKLDWDAMIGTLAPNGRLHVVGACWNRSPSRHSRSCCSSVACQARRLARRWRSRRCSTLLHGTMSRRRPSTFR
jgi:D-arabinose 1-dehydrogenase-like Zn-dependent alcohol dehydrogenase